jgi:hypothetical protein
MDAASTHAFSAMIPPAALPPSAAAPVQPVPSSLSNALKVVFDVARVDCWLVRNGHALVECSDAPESNYRPVDSAVLCPKFQAWLNAEENAATFAQLLCSIARVNCELRSLANEFMSGAERKADIERIFDMRERIHRVKQQSDGMNALSALCGVRGLEPCPPGPPVVLDEENFAAFLRRNAKLARRPRDTPQSPTNITQKET